MASPDEGRCVSCGFLAKYAQSPDALHVDIYLEANQNQRNRGDLLMLLRYEVRTAPVCFMNVVPIGSLVTENAKTISNDRQLAVREIINEDRQCPQWYPYTPGFTPKEHADKLAMQQLEQGRKDLVAMSERIQRDNLKTARASLRNTKLLSIA